MGVGEKSREVTLGLVSKISAFRHLPLFILIVNPLFALYTCKCHTKDTGLVCLSLNDCYMYMTLYLKVR